MDGLDLKVGHSSSREYDDRPTRWKTRRRSLARFIPFLLVVVIPTVVAGTYLFGYASWQYVSEAKFVVRGPATQSPGMLNNLLQTAGVSRAQDDTYAVQDYIMSRDALRSMVDTQGLRDIYDRADADIISRFPTFWRGDTFEHLYRYYQQHVDVALDTTTGVTTLAVQTYRAEDSERIARALLAGAEDLVNRMNVRQRDNAMRDARTEVARAEERLKTVAAEIALFRNREAVLDPNKQSVPLLQGITELQTLLSRVNLQVAQLTVSSPRSPLIAEYKRRAAALQEQIDEAKSKVTGTDKSMVPKITEFDALSLQRDLADRQLVSATTSLESARMQAERQQLYLDMIVQPNVADYAAYPKRFSYLAVVFATAFGVYLLAALLISSAREHRIV